MYNCLSFAPITGSSCILLPLYCKVSPMQIRLRISYCLIDLQLLHWPVFLENQVNCIPEIVTRVTRPSALKGYRTPHGFCCLFDNEYLRLPISLSAHHLKIVRSLGILTCKIKFMTKASKTVWLYDYFPYHFEVCIMKRGVQRVTFVFERVLQKPVIRMSKSW